MTLQEVLEALPESLAQVRELLLGGDVAKSPAKGKVDRTKVTVHLHLSEADHARVQAVAKKVGLGKAPYARQAILERVRADEQRTG